MSASFRSILQQVTEEKLGELRIQKDLLTKHFSPALEAAATTLSTNPRASLQVLYEALRDTPVKDTIDGILIENLKHLLQNSLQDPSITPQLLTSWITKVKQEIEHALRKTSYSFLYASLLTEWLALEEKKKGQSQADGGGNLEKTAQDMEAAKKKIQALMTREASAEEFDSGKFRQFLTSELFNFGTDPQSEEILKGIRAETKEFMNVQNDVTITTHDLQCCITGLCAENLLSQEKKSALKELGENSEALEEVATLLTSRLKNLARWDWPIGESQNLEIRRGLAGEWKGFVNEDVITALFLQYIGVTWAAFFKRQFLRIYQSRVWKKVDPLGSVSIEKKRTDFHQQNFLSGLPDSVQSQGNNVGEEYAKVAAGQSEALFEVGDMQESYTCHNSATLCAPAPRMMKRMARSCPQPPPPPPPKPDIDFKQSFLHMLSTEIRLNQVIRPDKPLVVVQADIESFSSTIIHEAVLICLEYFNVPAPWLTFFKKFLQPELNFGGKRCKIRTGVLESHVISNLFAEMLNFLLDFHVNQTCNGIRIYRMGDEFWYWSPEAADVLKAWETVNTFGASIGLRLNPNRSGSVAIFAEHESRGVVAGPAPLPQRSIHWGYLELHSSGTFKIDRKSIQTFVEEMRALLNRSECALEWINVFNKYAGIFKRNFGKCALVFRKQHLDQIIESLQVIYKELFGSELGNPVDSLKAKFSLLKESDIVDAWVHWPLERGGLGLVNPFIGVMALREAYVDIGDEDHFIKLPAEDKIIFDRMCKDYDEKYGTEAGGGQRMIGTGIPPKKLTWDEFVAKREIGNEFHHWYRRYTRLLERPSPKTPTVSTQYWDSGLNSTAAGDDGENYTMWLLTYYEPQLLLHFGTVNFINSKLLPMSMITNIQKSKVQH